MFDCSKISIEDLPPIAQELVHLIGLEATMKIVEHWGGIGLYFPLKWTSEHPTLHTLVQLIGHDKTRLLWEQFMNDEIQIPMCKAALRAVRDGQIRERRAAGTTIATLARENKMTETRVYQILRENPIRDDRQMGLF